MCPIKRDIVKINGFLENTPQELILDTGSELSLLSESNYNLIKASNKNHLIRELPVQNISIIGIAGSKIRCNKRQVLLRLKCGNFETDIVFLTFNNIPDVIILGCDFLRNYRTLIDLKNEMVIFEQNNKKYNCAIVTKLEAISRSYNIYVDESDVRTSHEGNLNYGNEDNVIYNNWGEYYTKDYLKEDTVEFNEEDKLPCAQSNDEALWEERIEEVRRFTATDEDIGTKRKQTLIDIYQKHKAVFRDEIGCAHSFQCKLQIKEGVIFNKKSYPVPNAIKPQVQKQIDAMLNDGIIEPSISQHTSPLVTVVKKNGDIRLCLDAREINKSIVGEKTSPGNMEEILRSFHGTRFISSFDAVSGYWQVSVHPDSRQYISFVFNSRSYQFTRLPFGLINSVAIFTRCIDQILGPEILSFATIYVDDFLITSSNFEQHCARVDQVLTRLQEQGITLKAAKSKFLTQHTKFLGYMLSPAGLEADPDKIKTIQNFPRPRNLKQTQSFIGLCNYYRAFQEKYSELTVKFSKVLSQRKPWKWGPEEEAVFNEIKRKFLQCVMLKHPDFSKAFYLNCDASNVSLGAELYQEDANGEHLVIAFASRVLSACERNYTVTELEMLSVVFACSKFRTYILGHEIVVRSDHKAISFFRECKLSHGRLTRWILALQMYNIKWEYVPGKENKVADTLSRVNCETGEMEDENENIAKVYTALRVREDLERILAQVTEEQQQDVKVQALRNRVEAADPMICDFYQIHENLLFNRKNDRTSWKLVVPETIIRKVILDYHERYGHYGAVKTYQALKEHFYFKGACKRVAQIVGCCDICQRVKVENVRREGELHAVLANERLDKIFLDICGPFPPSVRLGKKFIVVMLDCYTKYVKLYAVKRATTRTVLDCILNDYIVNVGKPKSIVTDHGCQFRGRKWHDELMANDIRTYKTSVFHPSSNLSERCLREAGRLLRTYCHQEHRNWYEYLPVIEEFMNLAYHDSINATPYEAMWRRKPPRIIEEIITFPEDLPEIEEERCQNLKQRVDSRLELRALQRWEKQQKRRYKDVNYGIGDLVLLRNHKRGKTLDHTAGKLMVLYYGPFRVTNIKGQNVYEIGFVNSPNVKGNYNANQMKPYKQPINP
jgi:hypothetical protein